MPLAKTKLPRLNEHTWQSFVSLKVKYTDVTKRIIDAIMPYFPRKFMVKGGYLTDRDAIWKVNWHWQSLILCIDRALRLEMSERHRKCARAIRGVLMSNPPNPQTGYREKDTLGEPEDKSDFETVMARWRKLRQSKRDFAQVIKAANVEDRLSTRTGGLSVLVVQYVAPPRKTKHLTGYALDIKDTTKAGKGDSKEIIRISKALGSTFQDDERFHVHVEFKNGVSAPGYLPAVSGASQPATAKPEAESSPALSAVSWDAGELLKTTKRAWNRLLEELF